MPKVICPFHSQTDGKDSCSQNSLSLPFQAMCITRCPLLSFLTWMPRQEMWVEPNFCPPYAIRDPLQQKKPSSCQPLQNLCIAQRCFPFACVPVLQDLLSTNTQNVWWCNYLFVKWLLCKGFCLHKGSVLFIPKSIVICIYVLYQLMPCLPHLPALPLFSDIASKNAVMFTCLLVANR